MQPPFFMLSATQVSSFRPWWRILERRQWLVFAAASLAWLFDCLDSQVFNLARDGAVEQLIADPSRATEYASYTTSFFLLGWAGGGLIFGSLGDRLGRARILAVTLLIYSVCTGLSAFANGYVAFCVCLVITGFGVGGVFGLSVALVADSVPDSARAPALGMMQSLSALGNIAAACTGIGVGVAAARGELPFGLKPWQGLFVIGALPALACVLLILRLPEPARWVNARAEGAKRGIKFGSYGQLLGNPRWSRNAWFGLVLCCAGIIGLWGIGNFHPKIVRSIVDSHFAAAHLTAEGLAGEKAHWSSLGLLLQNLGGFAGMLTLAKVAQAKGRRFAFLVALALSFLSTQMVFRFMREFDQIYWMLPIMGFGQYGVFGVYAIYLPELFPTSLRSTGTSFCYNFGRLAAASAPLTIGRITKSLGGDIEGFRTAGLWVSALLLAGIAVLPFLPETKDMLLPEE